MRQTEGIKENDRKSSLSNYLAKLQVLCKSCSICTENINTKQISNLLRKKALFQVTPDFKFK